MIGRKTAGVSILLILMCFGSEVLGDPEDRKSTSEKVVGTAMAGVGTGFLATTAGNAALTTVGFTAGGVVKVSIAAGIQAAIGNVGPGTLFAALQSVGAMGGLALTGPVGIGTAVLGGAFYLFG